MNQLIDGTITDFDEGDLVSGVVVKIEHDEVLVDIGFKSEGVIPTRELSIRKDANPEELVSLNDEIEAMVLQKEDKEGRLILSKRRAEYERAWNRIEEKFKNGENIQGEVIEVVKGGLILDIGLRGFLPASLVDLRRVKDLTVYLNTTIETRVIEMDKNRNNVVLSRRVVLEEDRKAERVQILSKLQKGMRLSGTVSSIVDFGCFVDLGGIDGLVHISELSWSHVDHPSEVVSVGQEVEVVVLEVEEDRERISLGIKDTTPDPWASVGTDFPAGAIVEGTVTKLVPFGVFIELNDGIEGLVHISEMANEHVDEPKQVTSVGEKIQVKVVDVDVDRRRISLSMKQAAEVLGTTIEVTPLPGQEKAAEEAEEAKPAEPTEEEIAEETEKALEEVHGDSVMAQALEEAMAEKNSVEEADEEFVEEAVEEVAEEPVEEVKEEATEEVAEEESAAEEATEEEPAEEEASEEDAAEEE